MFLIVPGRLKGTELTGLQPDEIRPSKNARNKRRRSQVTLHTIAWICKEHTEISCYRDQTPCKLLLCRQAAHHIYCLWCMRSKAPATTYHRSPLPLLRCVPECSHRPHGNLDSCGVRLVDRMLCAQTFAKGDEVEALVTFENGRLGGWEKLQKYEKGAWPLGSEHGI